MSVPTPAQGCPATTAACFDRRAAAAAWAALAEPLAARPAMRLARMTVRGGARRAVYDRGETAITADLPTSPAAVLLHTTADPATALVPVLAFDLDAKRTLPGGARAGRAGAAADAAAIAEAVQSAGGRCIVTAAPSGGRHVWIPLAEPLPTRTAAALAAALTRACPSLDPGPLTNAPTGCLRPPGAPHAKGGFQALLTPLDLAVDAVRRPSPPAVVEALRRLAGPGAAPAADPGPRRPPRADPAPADRRRLAPQWERLAALGPQPGEYRDDASAARWHLTMAAVRAGWTADEWVAAAGSWPWLAAQAGDGRRLALFRREFEKAAHGWRRLETVQNMNTSHQLLHGGGEGGRDHQQADQTDDSLHSPPPDPSHHSPAGGIHLRLRQARTWLDADLRARRTPPRTAAVARAVLVFAHSAESDRIQVGVRALAVAAGVAHNTAAAALHELAGTGFLTRVGRGVARGADVWCIDLALGDGLPPATGRLWATRPVFRAVGGHGAAEVYEALAAAAGPLSGRAIAAALGRSPTTVMEHLHELAAWSLAAGGGRDGWTVGPADPDELAQRLGAAAAVQEQIARYRAQRAAWWAWLDAHHCDPLTRRSPGLGQLVMLPAPTRTCSGRRPGPDPGGGVGRRAGPDPGPDVEEVIALIQDVLGGVVIAGWEPGAAIRA